MRGKANAGHMNELLNRITPAYAGKRASLRRNPQIEWDHPRLCGEKQKPMRGTTTPAGSPPPMRGKAVPRKMQLLQNGITPAYAGKSY